MKITIIGGGIGGLTTALCLHHAGFGVKVFESVKEIKPLGVGINILPHSVRVLTNIGLQDIIAKSAIETSDLIYFNKYGQQFWSEPRGRYAGYKWPQFSLHRGTLQMLLYSEVVTKLGSHNVVNDHHFSHYKEVDNEVIAYFKDKSTDAIIYEDRCDVLIGADGINSEVRRQLFSNEGPPIYSQNVLYRGTSRMKQFLNGESMAMIGSLKQKMVVYPIDPTPDANGDYHINWVGNIKEGKSTLTERDWNRQADQQRLIDLYKDWKYDWLDVPGMIALSPAVYEFPMSDRNPLQRWSYGRVTLLGDAAHPMYPIGSNGASQAILDADAITEALTNFADPNEALKAYNDIRVPATTKVVLQNRAKGPDEIMDMMEEWFPNGFSQNEIPHDKLATVMDNYKKVAGFDIVSLNQKN